MSYRVGPSACLLLLIPATAAAQADCFPPPDSHEAQTFAMLSTPLAFSGVAAQGGRTVAGLEVTSIPTVPTELATPTICRPGKGPENTNPVAGFLRVRIEVPVGGWRLDLGWIPPVKVGGMRSNLIGIGMSRGVALTSQWTVWPRVHVLVGRVRGPITCNEAALEQSTSECFQGTLSNDRWDPNIVGVEATITRHGHAFVPHAGLGWSWLRPRFQVDFTNSFGETDRRRVEVDLARAAVFGGLSANVGTMRVTGEGYLTIGDRVAGRVMARLPL